ncbi:MAG: adenylate kinase, partial [Gaiellaceae bacterium]
DKGYLVNINGQQDINKVFEDIDVLLGALQN